MNCSRPVGGTVLFLIQSLRGLLAGHLTGIIAINVLARSYYRIGHVVSSMDKDRIRYLVRQHGRWKWKPTVSNRLHNTYGPVQLASVRDADDARQKGRAKFRAVQAPGEQRPDKNPRILAGKFPNRDHLSARPLKTMARATGLEPAASGVTDRRSNQLSYARRDRNARRVGRVRVGGRYARLGG